MNDATDDRLATLPLFALPPIEQPTLERGQTLAERFQAFHKANPHVYAALARLMLDMQRTGAKRWSVKAAFEILRYMGMRTYGDAYKLNNIYTSAYSRMLTRDYPSLIGFVEQRESEFDHTGLKRKDSNGKP